MRTHPRPARPPSLLQRLFVRIGALFAAVVLVIGAATYVVVRDNVDATYDDQLIVGAELLHLLMTEELTAAQHDPSMQRGVASGEAPLLTVEDKRAFGSYAEWRMFRVWAGRKVVLHSGAAPPQPAPPETSGFRDIQHAGERWRMYVLRLPDHGVTIEVGERMATRQALVRAMLLLLAGPLLVLAPIAALLIVVALRNGLRTLRDLLDGISGRPSRDLSPIAADAWPRDLHPLIRATNDLLARIASSLQHERRFLDDAAHQLRTPLAAVKLQAQMIAEETDAEERRLLVADLLASVDRASILTNDLLTLARLDAGEIAGVGVEGDLHTETVAALADLAPVAAKRQIALALDGDGSLPGGDARLLRLVAANLIENAIHHAPPGSEVEVRLQRGGAGRRLIVTDAGPGIPEAERPQVVQRFHRGRSGASGGSGLGLSITTTALDLLGGALHLEDRDDGAAGLQARVELPAYGRL